MKFVVMVNGQPQGPFDLGALINAIQQGKVSPSALAWHEGCEKWTELQQISEVQSMLTSNKGTGENAKAAMPAPSTPAAEETPAIRQPQSLNESRERWYYLEDDKTCGPCTTDELHKLLAADVLSPSTYVFRKGMRDWAKLSDIPELHREPAATTLPEPPSNEWISGRLQKARNFHAENKAQEGNKATLSNNPPPPTIFFWWPNSMLFGGLLIASYNFIYVPWFILGLLGTPVYVKPFLDKVREERIPVSVMLGVLAAIIVGHLIIMVLRSVFFTPKGSQVRFSLSAYSDCCRTPIPIHIGQ